ncbi:hypothetical protein J6590_020594 [Homalodisca vitripennis]|nr:hypothetical protein J6590_020594 [Homalodisca vitripennis]
MDQSGTVHTTPQTPQQAAIALPASAQLHKISPTTFTGERMVSGLPLRQSRRWYRLARVSGDTEINKVNSPTILQNTVILIVPRNKQSQLIDECSIVQDEPVYTTPQQVAIGLPASAQLHSPTTFTDEMNHLHQSGYLSDYRRDGELTNRIEGTQLSIKSSLVKVMEMAGHQNIQLWLQPTENGT